MGIKYLILISFTVLFSHSLMAQEIDHDCANLNLLWTVHFSKDFPSSWVGDSFNCPSPQRNLVFFLDQLYQFDSYLNESHAPAVHKKSWYNYARAQIKGIRYSAENKAAFASAGTGDGLMTLYPAFFNDERVSLIHAAAIFIHEARHNALPRATHVHCQHEPNIDQEIKNCDVAFSPFDIHAGSYSVAYSYLWDLYHADKFDEEEKEELKWLLKAHLTGHFNHVTPKQMMIYDQY